MKQKRFSNKLKQKQLQTKSLEEQTKKMEDKLAVLKQQIQEQKQIRSQLGLDNTLTRWQKTTKPAVSLKSYAKQVLQQQKQAYSHFGINSKTITGTKTFQNVLKKIKNDKEEQEDRKPTKIPTIFKQQQAFCQPMPEKIVLADNFFKAKMDVASLIKQKTLEQFLEENFIQEYLPVFEAEGITDLQGLRYVSRQRLGQLGVKAGHQVKIIKRIKEEFERMLQGKSQKQQKQDIQNKYLPDKIEFGYGQGDVNQQTGKYQQVQEQFYPLHQGESKPPLSDQGEYEEQQMDEVLITAPMIDMGLQAAQDEQRLNCYQCYKTILVPHLHHDEKYFCSDVCMQKYMVGLRKTCPSCGKKFIKTQGYRQQALWFCSLGCCPNHEEIEEMFFEWHQMRH